MGADGPNPNSINISYFNVNTKDAAAAKNPNNNPSFPSSAYNSATISRTPFQPLLTHLKSSAHNQSALNMMPAAPSTGHFLLY